MNIVSIIISSSSNSIISIVSISIITKQGVRANYGITKGVYMFEAKVHIYIYIYIYVFINIYIYVYIYIRIRMHTQKHIIHLSLSLSLYIYIYIYTHVSLHVGPREPDREDARDQAAEPEHPEDRHR